MLPLAFKAPQQFDYRFDALVEAMPNRSPRPEGGRFQASMLNPG